jgi:hypothetical protein
MMSVGRVAVAPASTARHTTTSSTNRIRMHVARPVGRHQYFVHNTANAVCAVRRDRPESVAPNCPRGDRDAASARGALALGHRDGPLRGTLLKTMVRCDASAAILLLRLISLPMLRSERASPVNSVLVVFKLTVIRNRAYRNSLAVYVTGVNHDAFSGGTLARAQSEGLRYLSTGVWLSSDSLILKNLPDVTRFQESSSPSQTLPPSSAISEPYNLYL